jgi:DNA-binding winged helix-turn-helix (wHTH) protein
MPPASIDEPLRFGHFEIRPAERSLRIDGSDVAVGARAFDVLLALAQRRDRLVPRHELLDLVWPGVVVEEHNVATQISTLRKLLGPHVIATVPGRGYRFTVLPTEKATDGASDTLARERPSVPPLLGREDDLAALTIIVQHDALVTLTGAGGIGKTTVARALAHPMR